MKKYQAARRRRDATLLFTAAMILQEYPELNSSELGKTLEQLSEQLHDSAPVFDIQKKVTP